MHAPRGSQAPCSTVGAVPIPSLQQQGAQLFISPFGGEEKAAAPRRAGSRQQHPMPRSLLKGEISSSLFSIVQGP
ncbi:hypothetical protein Anapl_12879 [Anas platyrhynchos]|uniref:Uncharacterized protein n=1 Tax=Anas platyrhynchos TaxID=8839 RepID=R0M3L0_ANAPL|nr:hypothetical protein Anapl_12879 [Anas platyrhynchos]